MGLSSVAYQILWPAFRAIARCCIKAGLAAHQDCGQRGGLVSEIPGKHEIAGPQRFVRLLDETLGGVVLQTAHPPRAHRSPHDPSRSRRAPADRGCSAPARRHPRAAASAAAANPPAVSRRRASVRSVSVLPVVSVRVLGRPCLLRARPDWTRPLLGGRFIRLRRGHRLRLDFERRDQSRRRRRRRQRRHLRLGGRPRLHASGQSDHRNRCGGVYKMLSLCTCPFPLSQPAMSITPAARAAGTVCRCPEWIPPRCRRRASGRSDTPSTARSRSPVPSS